MNRIIQFAADTRAFNRSKADFERRRAKLTDSQRLDYGANFPNCPLDLINVGEAREEIVPPSLEANEVAVPVTDTERAAGGLVDGKWRVQQAKRTLTPEEIAAAFDTKKQNKLAELSREFSVRRNFGVTVSGYQELKDLKERLDRVGGTMIEADATQTTAIDDYIAACWSREYDLRAAINAVADATELEAIDITSGWPVSEQPQ